MAMKIGGYYEFKDVLPRHWERFAKDLGEEPKSQKVLAEKLRQRGFKQGDYPIMRNGKNTRIWKGLRIIPAGWAAG